MAAYHALVERLFTQDANVRNVKAFFSVRRAKFETRIALPAAPRQRLRTTRPFRYSPSGKSIVIG